MAAEGESVSSSFDKYLAFCGEIETSSLSSSSSEVQEQIKTTISGLIRTTVLVSEMGIFSHNEEIDDLATSSIKLLLLPALLGTLTLKRTDLQRPEILRLAAVYLHDYLQRCFEYGLTGVKPKSIAEEEEEEEEEEEGEEREERRRGEKRNKVPTPEELQAMAKHRQEKIQRFKEKKLLEGRLAELKKASTNQNADEEVQREYQLSLVKKFVYESTEELESVLMERKMLQKMSSLKLKSNSTSSTSSTTNTTTTTSTTPPSVPPLKPILITREARRRNVFGLGYPSQPSMTVEEFYDQRVREGWFPEPRSDTSCLQNRSQMTSEEASSIKEEEEEEEERREEDDDAATLERARERDEWRDTHRRGWGNTYNRS